MKAIINHLAAVALVCSCNTSGWTLVWEDDFKGTQIDTTIWSRTTRGLAQWAATQSPDPRLVEVRDGILYLKGMVNDDKEKDPADYITGGIVTCGKKGFGDGRVVIRARINDARGAWPALWMMPCDPSDGWPKGGEIDIMERLNSDPFIYQTVHSAFTHAPGHDASEHAPASGSTSPFNPGEFNEFGVDMHEDSLVFHVNGRRTFCYPRLQPGIEDQFPFFKDFYILMDMQLGGSWVGEVDPDDLPVTMDVDWVRFYKRHPSAKNRRKL